MAVAESGSFSATARSLGVAVSSITRRIEQLEDELRAPLFVRSSRRLVLTDAGEHLLPRAQAILADVAEAREGLSALGAEPRGVLTVTAPAMFGRQHIAPVLATFLAKHPQLEVEMHLGDEIVDLLERRIDVAIRIGVLPDSDLVATSLAPIRRVVCASADYLERAGWPQHPNDLLAHNCLTVASTPVPGGWWTFTGVNRNRPLGVHGNLRSDDTGTLLRAAIAGVGIVHLASWLVGDKISTGELIPLLRDVSSPADDAASIHAVRMPGRSRATKVKLFVDHLKHSFGAPPYWEKVGSAQADPNH